MSRREDIDNGIWSDPDFLELGPVARALYVWSFTNQRCGMAGIYKVARAAIEMETGWSGDSIDSAFHELREHRFAFYDGRVLFVRTRVKHLRTTSPTIAQSIRNDLAKVGNHEYVGLFYDEYQGLGWLSKDMPDRSPKDPLDTPSIPHGDPREGSQGKGKGRGKGKEGGAGETKRTPSPPPPDELPDDLDPSLHPAAQAVHTILGRIAAAKGAKPVTLAAVGRTVASYPQHDHPAVARDVEHWWVHGTGASKQMRDVVATYRNRLEALPPQPVGATIHQHPAASIALDSLPAAEQVRRINAAQDRLRSTTPDPEHAA